MHTGNSVSCAYRGDRISRRATGGGNAYLVEVVKLEPENNTILTELLLMVLRLVFADLIYLVLKLISALRRENRGINLPE